jgi:hypothetical protein
VGTPESKVLLENLGADEGIILKGTLTLSSPEMPSGVKLFICP